MPAPDLFPSPPIPVRVFTTDDSTERAVRQCDAGLRRQLTPRPLGMIALGGAIGTGLFLRRAVSVWLAGPGVILSHVAVRSERVL